MKGSLPDHIYPGDRVTFTNGQALVSPIEFNAARFGSQIIKIERPTTIYLPVYEREQMEATEWR